MQSLKNLSDQQQNAVQQDQNVILTACPGSGKTRVLTHKIAYELTKLPDSRSWIVGLTYTKRAADEISRRIQEMGVNTEKIWIGTIHSFCLEWILRPYAGCHDRLKNGFGLIDEVQAEHFINDLKSKAGLSHWERVTTKAGTIGKYGNSNQKHQQIADQYHAFLRENKVIDFDLVLLIASELLNDSQEIIKILAPLFAWVCVDEYQDTQELQYGIVGKILQNGKGKYFVAGDPNQSIYHNLGAVTKAFEEIESAFGNTAIRLTLDRCYRSTQRIVDFYSKFQQTRSLVTSHASYATEQGKIVYERGLAKERVDSYIGNVLKETLSNGVAPSDICIVAPNWWLVSPCIKKLRDILPDIKFDTVGKSGANKHRFNLWYKITCLLVSETSHSRIWYRLRLANEIRCDIEAITNTSMNSRYRNPREFLNLLNSLESNSDKITSFLNDCFEQIEVSLKLALDPSHSLMILKELYLQSLQAQEDGNLLPGNIHEFRSWFHDNDGVVVSSCHGLKGEEYDTVIAFGLLQGKIPHWDDIINRPQLAESNAKQLLYVICSRAKRNLYLISETGRVTQKNNPYSPTTLLKQVVFNYDSIEGIFRSS